MRLAPAAPFPTDRVGLAVSHKTAPSFEYGTLPAAAHCLVKFVTGKRGRSSTEDGCGHHRAFRGGGVLAAVLAGAVASLAITLVLLSFGAGMGFAVVSPWGNSGVSATTFKIGTGLYFIVMAMLSSAIGGYLAGRLRKKWIGVQTTEVQFRDTAHGFLAWAVASVLGAILLASPASSLVGNALSGAGPAAANAT